MSIFSWMGIRGLWVDTGISASQEWTKNNKQEDISIQTVNYKFDLAHIDMSVITKTIGKRKYAYLTVRKGKKVVHKYLGPYRQSGYCQNHI